MTDDTTDLGAYLNELTTSDTEQLERRLERHRDDLERRGYEATIARGDQGYFAGVIVIDDDAGRIGFLEEDGSVNWLTGEGGIGALSSAVVQRPTEKLDASVDDTDTDQVDIR